MRLPGMVIEDGLSSFDEPRQAVLEKAQQKVLEGKDGITTWVRRHLANSMIHTFVGKEELSTLEAEENLHAA